MIKPAFVDLSHHNVIPQSLVPAKNAGILGVIHKCTEGTSFVDDKCDNRYALVLEAGLLWGLYHFIRPGKIAEQADFFVETAANLSVLDNQTLLCLDHEDRGVSINDAVIFMERVQQRTGHEPVLYSGHVLKEQLNVSNNLKIRNYRLWLAQYAGDYVLPVGYKKLWAWQYTENGSVPGINPPVDLNAFPGTEAELRHSWAGAEVSPAPPIPETVAQVDIKTTGPVIITINGRTIGGVS